MAGGLPDRPDRAVGGDQPRPRLPGSGLQPDRRNRAGRLAQLSGQLQPAPGAEGARTGSRPGRLRASAEGAGQPAGLHRPLPGECHPQHPGEEPREAPRQGGADRGAHGGCERPSVPVPPGAPLRPAGGHDRQPHPQLWGEDPVSGGQPGGGARRSHRLRWAERGRQIHPAATGDGVGAAGGGPCGAGRTPRGGRLLRAEPGRGPRPLPPGDRHPLRSGTRLDPDPGAQHAGQLRLQ